MVASDARPADSPRSALARPWFLAVWLLMAASVTNVGAETGTLVRLPGMTPTNGLTMELDTRWVTGSGYHPVRVKIAIAGGPPAIAQRTFRVELRMHGSLHPEFATVSQYIDIDEGQLAGEATILVPQSDVWGNVEVVVYEDGIKLDELSGMPTIQVASPGDMSEIRPAVLFIDGDAPGLNDRPQRILDYDSGTRPLGDIPNVTALSKLRLGEQVGAISAPNTLRNTTIDKRGVLLPGDALPDQWLAYTGLDIVLVSLDDLQDLKRRLPAKWDALRRWVRAGGNLVVTAEDMTARRQELTQLLGARRLQGGTLNDNIRVAPNNVQGSRIVQPIIATWQTELGQGRIYAIEGQLEEFQWREYARLLNTMGTDRWTWLQRHGISTLRDTGDYERFEIPGVGEPPLLTFLASITLFVIVIGPVNYMFLKRARRLYLLLVTVPAGAAAVTGSIFLLALLSDGLGVRIMSRSFTDLDQVAGEYSNWSRQTYYAGVRPSRGLQFSDDTSVLPISTPDDDLIARTRRNPRRLHWESGQQLLQRGFLNSRQMAQFLVQRSAASKSQLVLANTKEGLTATNRLGAKIELVVYRDSDGAYYYGEQLGDGDVLTLKKTESPTVMIARMGDMASQQFDQPNNARRMRYYRRQYWYYMELDREFPDPTSESSCLELGLKACLATPSPGTYHAVLAADPFSEQGCKGTSVHSFHLVRGRAK